MMTLTLSVILHNRTTKPFTPYQKLFVSLVLNRDWNSVNLLDDVLYLFIFELCCSTFKGFSYTKIV